MGRASEAGDLGAGVLFRDYGVEAGLQVGSERGNGVLGVEARYCAFELVAVGV